MKWARVLSITFLALLCCGCVLAKLIAPCGYSYQFRDIPNARPSSQHWLGTDALGRDRFARVLYGTRVSLSLAPCAALLSSFLATLVGATGGFLGGRLERMLMTTTDLILSLPWLFLLITVRALLPLNVSPVSSVVITFALLGFLGWAAAARVICSDTRAICNSEFILQIRASGASGLRVLWRHVVPNVMPIVYAQFWISIPIFILTEANLGILGLGVSEPLPSWGSLLRELESYSSMSNYWQFVPLLLFVATISCLHQLMPDAELTV
jgi:peptide/nickel transport system permease protein